MDDFTDEQKIAAHATAECVEGDNLTYEASLARLQQVYRLGIAAGKATAQPVIDAALAWQNEDVEDWRKSTHAENMLADALTAYKEQQS